MSSSHSASPVVRGSYGRSRFLFSKHQFPPPPNLTSATIPRESPISRVPGLDSRGPVSLSQIHPDRLTNSQQFKYDKITRELSQVLRLQAFGELQGAGSRRACRTAHSWALPRIAGGNLGNPISLNWLPDFPSFATGGRPARCFATADRTKAGFPKEPGIITSYFSTISGATRRSRTGDLLITKNIPCLQIVHSLYTEVPLINNLGKLLSLNQQLPITQSDKVLTQFCHRRWMSGQPRKTISPNPLVQSGGLPGPYSHTPSPSSVPFAPQSPKSLVSGYKSHRINCLPESAKSIPESDSWRACKMGVFSKRVTLRICRIW